MNHSYFEKDAHPLHAFLCQLHQHVSRIVWLSARNQTATFTLKELYQLFEFILAKYQTQVPTKLLQLKQMQIKYVYEKWFRSATFFPNASMQHQRVHDVKYSFSEITI